MESGGRTKKEGYITIAKERKENNGHSDLNCLNYFVRSIILIRESPSQHNSAHIPQSEVSLDGRPRTRREGSWHGLVDNVVQVRQPKN